MAWRIRGLVAAVALLGLGACGVTRDEAVRLKEGATLGDPDLGLQYCTSFGCLYAGQACLEVFFEYGRSPALCLFLDVCDKLECEQQGQRCAIFDGYPGQVKCIDPED